jgi:hypothetical protein
VSGPARPHPFENNHIRTGGSQKALESSGNRASPVEAGVQQDLVILPDRCAGSTGDPQWSPALEAERPHQRGAAVPRPNQDHQAPVPLEMTEPFGQHLRRLEQRGLALPLRQMPPFLTKRLQGGGSLENCDR